MSRPTPGGSRGGQVMIDISEELIATLNKKAVTLRKHIIRMTHNAQSGHPVGSMSAADIVTALYFHVLRADPKSPTWPGRDRFVLSTCHVSAVCAATLAAPVLLPGASLLTLRKRICRVPVHPRPAATP